MVKSDVAALAAYQLDAAMQHGSARTVAVGDRRASYTSLPEKLPPETVLTELWAGQRVPEDALVTIDGCPVRVIHPGLRGRGPGPDFRHARLAINGGVIHIGDVELHVRATDFRVHGHHQDARYDGVVLHVVFEDDIGAQTLLSSGHRVPVVELAPRAKRRVEDIGTWLERSGRWTEPCHDAIERLGSRQIVTRLEGLGGDRFAGRTADIAADVARAGRAQALCRALLEGLGLGDDRAVAAALANEVQWIQVMALEGFLEAEALLLGMAGLLPSQKGECAGHPHEIELESAWRNLGVTQRVDASGLARLPASHPARRLAGLAQLLIRHRELMRQGFAATNRMEGAVSALINAWTVPANGYWQWNVAPACPSRRKLGALIGKSRAIELLINAVLPWMAACCELAGDSVGAACVRETFAALPVPARYGRLAFLEEHLRKDGERLRLTARSQQGLLALYKGECTQGGCGSCPLS